MKGFSGFPAGKQSYTLVPGLFFSELLPSIDHLGELKVTLHIFWLLSQKKGERRYVGGEELARDQRLLSGLASPALPPDQMLRDGLERAVARGTLLRVFTGEGVDRRDWYFVNSERGRDAVRALLAGEWALAEDDQPIHLQAHRPNIFVLYEQNVGPLTPLLAEELIEAEDTYPASWIQDAFREAVDLNKRSWRYVQRILERWAAEGKEGEAPQPPDEGDWRRFVKGEYGEYIEH